VKDCRFYPTGVVALLQTSQLVSSGYSTAQPRLLASPPSGDQILSWMIIPPQSSTRHVEVLLATRTTILVADQLEVQDQFLQQGPFSHMALSPAGRFLALYTPINGGGRVWVVYSDFQKGISDFTIPSSGNSTDGSVKQVGWVGDDAVAIIWEGGRVVIIGPTGGFLEYFYNEGVWAVEEVDGMRIYSSSVCEFVQKVPGMSCANYLIADISEDVFKVGSSSPAAVLLDAADHLERNSAKADEDIRLIRTQLTDAVDGCVSAAAHEWDHYWQKQLLRVSLSISYLMSRLPVLEKHSWNFTIPTILSRCATFYVCLMPSETTTSACHSHILSIPFIARLTLDILSLGQRK